MLIESKTLYDSEEEFESCYFKIESKIKEMAKETDYIKTDYIETGEIESYYIDVETSISNNMLLEVFDSIEGFDEFYSVLFDDDSFKEELYNQFGEIYQENILLINTIVIKPSFRGKNYGHRALKTLIKQFAKEVALVVLQPAPMQFSHPKEVEKFDDFVKDKDLALEKLAKHWEGIGFERIGDSCIWGLKPNKIFDM